MSRSLISVSLVLILLAGASAVLSQETPIIDKEALIVDIRENNGGYISAMIVSLLKKETYLRRSQRNSIRTERIASPRGA